jgi:magnesium-protoporphyrin O-methyltransferase
MVAFLEEQGIGGATMLEVGGGVGAIQIELLRKGVEHTVNLELSPAYDQQAAQLLAEAGFQDRAERRLLDIAADPQAVESADIVVLHQVVCCYPDYERLLEASAQHAQRLIVFSYPRRNALFRLLAGAVNLTFKLRRKEFRGFMHPPEAMIAAVEDQGLEQSFTHAGPFWQIAGLRRPPAQPVPAT